MEYGVVSKRLGPLNFSVKIGNQTKKVHVDYMLPNSLTDKDLKEVDTTEDWDSVPLEVPPTEPLTSSDTPSASARQYTYRNKEIPTKIMQICEMF